MLATHPDPVPAFRGRIGQDPRSGYHAVPHRYRLYLTPSCPECLRIAVTHDLLGMGDTLPVTLLPALPDTADGGHGALRPLYEAGSHRHPGPALAPVLGDDWTGRIVSTHAPDILRDGARWFGGPGAALRPCEAQEETETVDRLCERGITASAHRAGRADADAETRDAALTDLLTALDGLERRLAGRATSSAAVADPPPRTCRSGSRWCGSTPCTAGIWTAPRRGGSPRTPVCGTTPAD